jgi:hypothetical protein
MEFTQFHSFRPQSAQGVGDELRALLAPAWLHRRASFGVAVRGPWRPADLWPGGMERLVWTVSLEGEVHLSDAGAEALGRAGLLRRRAPVQPLEALARRQGDGLVVVHSDAAQLAYVAVYRERHLAWSLLLQDRVRLVRCDGEVVVDEAPPRRVPEVDRAGVLLAGLHQWLREPIEIDPEERLVLADTVGGITLDEPVHPLVDDGGWIDLRECRRKLA